ncbi:MAG: hypothetical protein R3F11_23245 [Verrucomicrobiales bacterium]
MAEEQEMRQLQEQLKQVEMADKEVLEKAKDAMRQGTASPSKIQNGCRWRE